MPTDDQFGRVRNIFDSGRWDESPFEELVLSANRGLKIKIEKGLRPGIIAKLINRLRTVELKVFKDDEDLFLEKAREYLDSENGKKWSECCLYSRTQESIANSLKSRIGSQKRVRPRDQRKQKRRNRPKNCLHPRPIP